jgi:class 3 adenylate cyclase/predicted ATPase
MAENVATRRFCAKCGSPLPSACPACGFENEPAALFCGGCGKPLGETAAAIPPVASAPPRADGAERRQLTVMFCDLVGSTALASRLDPEDLREVIGAYHRCVAETIGRFDGFVAKYMGDGVLAYFGYPNAHEDDAERAIRAGIALIEAVGALDAPHPLRVHIGIATGLVVVGDLIGEGSAQERGVVGETPNLAARMQALAGPDEIVIPENTRRLVGSLFEYESLGEVEVKGFLAPVLAFRVLRESQVGSRFEALRSGETRLVGREEEIELLNRRWVQAKAGAGRVVLISAEPGVGKSRLAEAFRESLEGEPHTRLRYFCAPHHQDSALFPFIGQLERAAGFERDDTTAARLKKLEALVVTNAPAEGDVPLLAELLSLPLNNLHAALELTPQRKKEKTFEALLRQLAGLALRQPVLMIFEDLHWADPTSCELLDLTVEQIEGMPVLLIATFRPEFQPPWTGQPQVMTLSLRRLGRQESGELVRGIIGSAAALSSEVVDEIVERTDGVPLFLEELTKAVVETAISGADAGKGAVSSVPATSTAVPATLHASLMARLDWLGPTAKEVAQVGAAIGRDFSYELLLAASQCGEAETREALDRLVAAALMFQRGIPPAAEYQFKHALVQDTAYGTLLRGPRQALHTRIAEAIQKRSSETVERVPEVLAHHLTEAGQFDSAATYWLEAGRREAGRSANIEAAAHLARGIVGLSGLAETPERNRQELALQLALGPVLLSNRGYETPDVRGAYRRAADLARRLGDDRARFAATWGLWITTQGGDREDENRLRHLRELVQIADRIGDRELSLQAHHSSWATWMFGGEFVRSQDHIRQGLALYDPEKHRHHALMYGGHDPGVCGKGQGALGLWALGYPDQAAQSAREGIVLAEALGHVPSVLHSLWFAGVLYCLRGDVTAACNCGARLLALGREHSLMLYQAIGGILDGWALTQIGNGEDGLAELRSSVGVFGASARFILDLFGALLAEAELLSGNFEQAAVALDRAEEVGKGWWRAEFLRLRGDLQRSKSVQERYAAEQLYREAIAVAQSQSAKSLEVRAATSLARLWREQGRWAEAHDLLAPVYGWFTEGFDTPDLKEAKALLDELG